MGFIEGVAIFAICFSGVFLLQEVLIETDNMDAWNYVWKTPYRLLHPNECWITGEPQVCEIGGEQMYVHGGFSIDMDLKECVEQGFMGSEAYKCMFAKKQDNTKGRGKQ